MTSPRATETGAQLAAGAVIPSAAFCLAQPNLVPVFRHWVITDAAGCTRYCWEEFTAIFIPIGKQ